MSDMETRAISKAIDEKFKNSWNQTRMIANGLRTEPIEFPWDNEEIPKIAEKPLSSEDIMNAMQNFEEHINKRNH